MRACMRGGHVGGGHMCVRRVCLCRGHLCRGLSACVQPAGQPHVHVCRRSFGLKNVEKYGVDLTLKSLETPERTGMLTKSGIME